MNTGKSKYSGITKWFMAIIRKKVLSFGERDIYIECNYKNLQNGYSASNLSGRNIRFSFITRS